MLLDLRAYTWIQTASTQETAMRAKIFFEKPAFAIVAMLLVAACGNGGGGADALTAECNDGKDNDEDGTKDFPEDVGCTSPTDDTENSLASPACMDGRDNDGDGRTDYPGDPGCFAPQADDETDDCPSGPQCPQCADGKDNDNSGGKDYPEDPGCTSASDDLEFLSNPVACGAGLLINQLPTSGMLEGMLESGSVSQLASPCGGMGAPARAYELHLEVPRVVEVSTENSTTDTVIQIRGEECMAADAHLECNDNMSSEVVASKLVTSLQAGDYYIIVSGTDTATTGPFFLTVKTFAGEGTPCSNDGQCGPGLVCRTPMGAPAMVCSKPRCADMDDEDGDGKPGYPTDPGCTSRADNDEMDDCPNGPNCPECGDGRDNDGDMATDHPADMTCAAAGDASEACISSDGVSLITGPMTMGTTTGVVNDVTPECVFGTHTAPDKTYRIDIPALSSLDFSIMASFDVASLLLNANCDSAAPIECSSGQDMTVQGLAAGTYYFVVDGWGSENGPFTINLSGRIQNGQSCEGVLAQSGALACGAGFACKGTMGMRTCQPGLCGDGMDNDGDGKFDFPFDPGCTDIGDDTEADPMPLPVCGNGMDEDMDMTIDFPADYGCASASGTSEVFCMAETEPTSLITTTPVMGTTAGGMNNMTPSGGTCSSGSAPDKVYALSLPVPVETLVIDTNMSGFDTQLAVQNAQCNMSIACDDDGGEPGTQSRLSLTNVAPGNYAIVVDGFSSASGMYILNIKGTVAPGTRCTSPLFTGGANAILACPMGTTCSAGPNGRCM